MLYQLGDARWQNSVSNFQGRNPVPSCQQVGPIVRHRNDVNNLGRKCGNIGPLKRNGYFERFPHRRHRPCPRSPARRSTSEKCAPAGFRGLLACCPDCRPRSDIPRGVGCGPRPRLRRRHRPLSQTSSSRDLARKSRRPVPGHAYESLVKAVLDHPLSRMMTSCAHVTIFTYSKSPGFLSMPTLGGEIHGANAPTRWLASLGR
jgi:hypothetical protein